MDSGSGVNFKDFLTILQVGGFSVESQKKGLFNNKSFYMDENRKILSYDGRNINLLSFEKYQKLPAKEKKVFENTVQLVKRIKKQAERQATREGFRAEERKIEVGSEKAREQESQKKVDYKPQILQVNKLIEDKQLAIREENIQLQKEKDRFFNMQQKAVSSASIDQKRSELVDKMREKSSVEEVNANFLALENAFDEAFNTSSKLAAFRTEMLAFLNKTEHDLKNMSSSEYVQFAKAYTKALEDFLPKRSYANFYEMLCSEGALHQTIMVILEDAGLQDLSSEVREYFTAIAELKLKGFRSENVEQYFPYHNQDRMQIMHTDQGMYLATDTGMPVVFDAKENTFKHPEIIGERKNDIFAGGDLSPDAFKSRMKIISKQMEQSVRKEAIKSFEENRTFLVAHLPFFSDKRNSAASSSTPTPVVAVSAQGARHDSSKTDKETFHNLQRRLSNLEAELQQVKSQKSKILTEISNVAGKKMMVGNQAFTDLSDPNRPGKIQELYSALYDNEWTDAVEKLNEKFTEEESVIILRDSILAAYEYFQNHAQKVPLNTMKALGLDLQDRSGSSMEEAFFEFSVAQKIDFDKVAEKELIPRLRKKFPTCDSKSIWGYLKKSLEICSALVKNGQGLVNVEAFENSKDQNDNFRSYMSSARPGRDQPFTIWPALVLDIGNNKTAIMYKGVMDYR